MTDRIKAGLIGLGRSGRDIHGALLSASAHFEVAAVADMLGERLSAAAAAWGCRTYADYRGLLADKGVELVVVATPSVSHCRITVDALRAGKAVVVDKPMSVSVAEADRMIAESEKTGRLLTVFQNRRFDPDFLTVRKVIDSGVLGEILHVRRGSYGYSRRTDWQAVRKFGGGMLNNWGAHILDQLLALMNWQVTDVRGLARQTVSAGDAEDTAVVLLIGPTILAQADLFSCCAAPQPAWLVMGRCGTLVGDEAKFQVTYCDPARLPPLPKIEDIPPAAVGGYPSEAIEWKEQTVEALPCAGIRGYYDRLYETIRLGGPPAIRPQESRMVVWAIERCKQQSAGR